LEESREAIRLELSNWLTYLNLASAYQNLNRLDEAEAVYKQAEERNLGGGNLLGDRYALAFVRGDTAQLSLLATAVTGKPGMEDFLLAIQGDAGAWYGKLRNARDLMRRAMDSAKRNDSKRSPQCIRQRRLCARWHRETGGRLVPMRMRH
jgi:eukaryotic-like serine/threonine-protein kinase